MNLKEQIISILESIEKENKDLSFSEEEAKKILEKLGNPEVDIKEFTMGLNVELEHGTKLGKDTNITNDDPIMTAKIALAHLKELPDYYTRLKEIEK